MANHTKWLSLRNRSFTPCDLGEEEYVFDYFDFLFAENAYNDTYRLSKGRVGVPENDDMPQAEHETPWEARHGQDWNG